MSIIPHPSLFVSPWNDQNQTALYHEWFIARFNEGIQTQYTDHLLVQLSQHLDFTPIEQVCAVYHNPDQSRAPILHPVSRLVRALLVKYLYGWSYRQTEEQINHHQLVRWFVGYAPFAPTLDHSTLHLFALWLEKHHPRLFFDAVLQQIDARFPQQNQRIQVGDTFALRVRATWESLPTLLRHATANLLTAMQIECPTQVEELLPFLDALAVFGPEQEKVAYRLSVEELLARALTIVRGVDAWLGQLRPFAPWPSQVSQWLGYLDKIMADEFFLERDEQGGLLKVTIRPAKEKGAYRLISATDPEATLRVHGEKKDCGYNIQLSTDGEFVTSIHAHTGAVPDSVGVEQLIIDQKAHRGSVPPKLVYDKAAGTGKKLFDVAQASDGQTQLVVPLVDLSRRSDRFRPDHFLLTPDGGLTCPHGQTSYTAYRSGSAQGWTYRFAAATCADCPLVKACRGDKAVKEGAFRQVFISDYLYLHRQAIVYQQSEAFAADMKLRPEVERVIAILVQHQDARYAHGYGLAKADFQMKMSGMAFNLKAWMHKLELGREAALPEALPAKPKRSSHILRVKAWLREMAGSG